MTCRYQVHLIHTQMGATSGRHPRQDNNLLWHFPSFCCWYLCMKRPAWVISWHIQLDSLGPSLVEWDHDHRAVLPLARSPLWFGGRRGGQWSFWSEIQVARLQRSKPTMSFLFQGTRWRGTFGVYQVCVAFGESVLSHAQYSRLDSVSNQSCLEGLETILAILVLVLRTSVGHTFREEYRSPLVKYVIFQAGSGEG